MNRSLQLSTTRQHLAFFGMAAVMTVSVLASLGQLAQGYQADAAYAAYAAAAPVVQQVVVVGQRPARS